RGMVVLEGFDRSLPRQAAAVMTSLESPRCESIGEYSLAFKNISLARDGDILGFARKCCRCQPNADPRNRRGLPPERTMVRAANRGKAGLASCQEPPPRPESGWDNASDGDSEIISGNATEQQCRIDCGIPLALTKMMP